MKLTERELNMLNQLFGDTRLKTKKISADKFDTDLAVKFHDAAGKALTKNRVDKAISKYTDCILVGYNCMKSGKPFYPGVVCSALYWLAMAKAKKAEYNVALAIVKQARIMYMDLNKESDLFNDKIQSCEELIISLVNEIEKKEGV